MGIWAIIRDALFSPPGYTLVDAAGRQQSVNGNAWSHHLMVIRAKGVSYVRTTERDDRGFLVYREDHLTYDHEFHGE